ncbi:MAG: hypothetical protein ABTQ31_10255 [Rhizobiaceae bacterium]
MTRTAINRLGLLLLEQWDPIGIADEPAARDEYDMYARRLEARVLAGASRSDLQQFLLDVEGEEMGLAPDSRRAAVVVGRILEIYRGG